MKVTLKIKNGETVESVQQEIEQINLFQLQSALKVIKEVFEHVQEDPDLQHLFKELVEDDGEEEEIENETDMLSLAVNAFDVLLINIPNKAFELLAALSGVEYKTLMEQKAIDIFDIYDAVLEVNDVEKLVNRAKKSLAATKIKMKFMQKAKKATAEVTPLQ